MALKKSGGSFVPPDDVKDAINGFNAQVTEALEQFDKPAWLGTHSPLAAPYFLGAHLTPVANSQAPTVRGRVLQQVLLEAASRLTDLSDAQQAKGARLKAQMNQGSEQHQKLYFDHLTDCIRTGDKGQRMIYWSFVHQPRFAKIEPILDEDRLDMGRTTYYRRLPEVIQQLTQTLLDNINPTLRLERPAPPPQFVGRTDIIDDCLNALRAGRTVALTGAGGVGKTALGAHLVGQLNDRPAFWFTVRPGLNDHLSSLLFDVSYFLYRQGAGVSWLQLVAGESRLKLNIVQGLILDDLKRLPKPAVLCIDEIDLLQPEAIDTHGQICAFLRQLQEERLALVLIGQRMPVYPTFEADLPYALDGLASQDLEAILDQAGLTLSTENLARLHGSIGGNPRLLELFVSLYRSGESLEQALDRMATTPALDVLLLRVANKLKPTEQRLLRQLAVFRRSAPTDAWNNTEEHAAFERLLAWQLIQKDNQGGVALMPALRDILYPLIRVEEKEMLHLRAATIRAKHGEYTAAAYHYVQGGQPRLGIWTWYLHRDNERNGGQAEAALAILRHISGNQLAENDRTILALARSELEVAAGRYDHARASLALVGTPKDDLLAVLVEKMRGHVAALQEEFDNAINAYRQSLATVERLTAEVALFHKHVGWSKMRQKYLDEGWQEACLARYEAENLQGYIQMERGNYTLAQSYFEGALRLAEEIQYKPGQAKTSDNLGRMLAMCGMFEESDRYASQAAQIFAKIGYQADAMGTRINQAMTLNLAQQPNKALVLAQETLAWFEQTGETWGQAAAAQNLAEAYLALGDLRAAETFAQRVIDSEEQGTLPDGLRVKGEIKLAQGAFAEAEEAICTSIKLAEENQDRYLAAYGWRSLSSVYAAQERTAEAQNAHNKAIKLFEELALPHEVERMRGLLAQQAAG